MPEPLRVAVIGVGAMGANHVRVFDELPGAELVAVADADPDRLQSLACATYGDYRELLASERPAAVSVAAPTRLHREVGLACIEHGAPVLIEKPLAADGDEGEELLAAAETSGVPLMVGQIERFNPAVRELKRLLDAGELGRVLQARARRVGPFFRRQRDVGVVHDLATHDIDVLRHVLDSDVERVQAETQRGLRTEHEDSLAGLLRFESGVVASLDVNWLTPVKVRELTVLGERGVFVVDYLTQELCFYEGAPAALLEGTGAWQTALPRVEAVLLPVEPREPLRAELESFLNVARGLGPPPVGAADGLAAIRVADALVESGRRGEPVLVTAGGTAR